MAKTQEELKQLKIEYETLNNKLKELSEEELDYVNGGTIWDIAVKLKEKFMLNSSSNNGGKVGINPEEHNVML